MMRIMPFPAILTTNTTLPQSSLAVAGDTCCFRTTSMHYIDGKDHP